jgi:alpha-amylase
VSRAKKGKAARAARPRPARPLAPRRAFAARPAVEGETAVVFYFQVHQPFRIRHFTFFDIGQGQDYFDDEENKRILERVAERCYLPMNALLLRAIERSEGAFRCAFSISGTALEQMQAWAPEALASFQELAATGCVEFLSETSHHSLACMAPAEAAEEFELQVQEGARRVESLFGARPRTFRNTELVVSNEIAQRIETLGFSTILGEGADRLLDWRSPHFVYRPQGCRQLRLLLRSYKLSDDIAFRFSNKQWDQHPLFADRFAQWIHEVPPHDQIVGLFMDFETFGEHQWEETGIFDFMEHLPEAIARKARFSFRTPAEVAERHEPVATLDIPQALSWADAERDLSAWLGNPMQKAAHEALYAILPKVRARSAEGDAAPYRAWRKLSTSDHVYYMCTKFFSDGDVHKYFSPYRTPHDAFISYMNVIDDLARRVDQELQRPTLASPSTE